MAPPFPSPTSKWHSTTYDSLSPSRPELSATGKTVVITGGGTGIGAETARYFAQAGASRIALFGRRQQPLLDTRASIEQIATDGKKKIEVFAASTDVTDKEQVNAAFDAFLGGGGSDKRIDVMVSNVAMIGPLEPVSTVDDDRCLDNIHQNLKGSLYVAQAFLRYAAKDAVVIDVNSNAAHLNYAPAFVSYSVAKLAVYRLWDCVAFEHPDMSVFHVQPGVVDTDMNRSVGGIAAIGYEDHVSLPASFHLWLASPEARFLKGKYLWANWDVDELKTRAAEIEKGSDFNIQLVGYPFGESDWKVPGKGW